MLKYVLIAGTHTSVAGWLANLVGLLGGFGWEAVSALVLVSGFSLTLSLGSRKIARTAWLEWFRKRAERILVPFYLVAIPFMLAYLPLLILSSHLHGAFWHATHAKLAGLFMSPLLGVVMSHTVLFDPFAPYWSADFFAPAWWFVPAILIAYLTYPNWRSVVRSYELFGLAVAAGVTVAAYCLADAHVIGNETWYFIALQEAFNFVLGIFVAGRWARYGRSAVEPYLLGWRPFAIGFLAFVAGSVLNWSPSTRPVASMLYAPGIVLTLIGITAALENTGPMRYALRTLDSYDLYLVHQPFAFPVAMLSRSLFHGLAVFLGFFIFVAMSGFVSIILGWVQQPVYRLIKGRMSPALM